MDRTRSRRPQKMSTQLAEQSPRLRLLWTPEIEIGEIKKSHHLPRGLTHIGRDPENGSTLAVQSDPCASRRHARIERGDDEGSVRISDCGSRHGTLLNGAPITGTALLQDGDLLRIGDSFLLFRSGAAEAAPIDSPPSELVGVSAAIVALRQQIARLAGERATILLIGETGTGKEVAANALHRLSGRLGPRIAVNCGAIPKELAESQFFGHVRAAFTGAVEHSGYFRAAHRGTLFLDEVAELSLDLQPKLLRALEERAVMPVGSSEIVQCDVRLIAATLCDLEQAVAGGLFREDLYARICDVTLRMPPLRERREDILLLLRRANDDKLPSLPSDFIDLLLRYDWPRNVREVYKVATHLRLFGSDEALRSRLAAGALPTSHAASPSELDERPKLVAPTKQQLEVLMSEHGGVIQDVANALGCSRRQVGRWLEQYQLDRSQYRKPRT